MKNKASYSNKGIARKIMTILLDNNVMFETIRRRNKTTTSGEWELGIKFFLETNGWQEIFPFSQNDELRMRYLFE